MDKDILIRSKLHKVFATPSRVALDLTYVITADGSFVITADGAYVVVWPSARKRLLSLIDKWITYMVEIQKILLKKSRIKKEKELDG